MVIIGNASHTIHPVTGQGFNLGIRDVAVLADIVTDVVRSDGDPGGWENLQRYAHWRRRDQNRVVKITDTLARLFANPLPHCVWCAISDCLGWISRLASSTWWRVNSWVYTGVCPVWPEVFPLSDAANNLNFDLIIVGGGMVGCALACAGAEAGFRVCVLEAQAPQTDWPPEEVDLRVSALSRASQRILHNLGAWERMAQLRVSPYSDMHVWDAGGQGEHPFQRRRYRRTQPGAHRGKSGDATGPVGAPGAAAKCHAHLSGEHNAARNRREPAPKAGRWPQLCKHS